MFKVAEDVVVDGHVVIAKDALVKGEVAAVKKSGFFGRGGNLGSELIRQPPSTSKQQNYDPRKVRPATTKPGPQ